MGSFGAGSLCSIIICSVFFFKDVSEIYAVCIQINVCPTVIRLYIAERTIHDNSIINVTTNSIVSYSDSMAACVCNCVSLTEVLIFKFTFGVYKHYPYVITQLLQSNVNGCYIYASVGIGLYIVVCRFGMHGYLHLHHSA